MPLTQLDPTPALVIIDLQKGITGMPTVHPAADIIARCADLADAFRAKSFPVILVNVAGRAPGRADNNPTFNFPPDWAELVPELRAQPSDLRVTKLSWGAFLTTNLDTLLRRHKVTQIVLAGISTSAGVESTARSAFDLGYNIVIPTDATTDRDSISYEYCIQKVFPRLAELTTTQELLTRLQQI